MVLWKGFRSLLLLTLRRHGNLLPLTRYLWRKHLSNYPFSTLERIFVFFHADLCPPNIMVSEEGLNTGIIDWETAAFYPRVWIATKPQVSHAFVLGNEEKGAWSNLLVQALEEQGFVSDVPKFKEWRLRIRQGL